MIKRFRSYKKLSIPHKKVESDKKVIEAEKVESKFLDRIGLLKERVKENPNKTRDISVDKIRPA